MNQLINLAVSGKMSALLTVGYLKRREEKGSRQELSAQKAKQYVRHILNIFNVSVINRVVLARIMHREIFFYARRSENRGGSVQMYTEQTIFNFNAA